MIKSEKKEQKDGIRSRVTASSRERDFLENRKVRCRIDLTSKDFLPTPVFLVVSFVNERTVRERKIQTYRQKIVGATKIFSGMSREKMKKGEVR